MPPLLNYFMLAPVTDNYFKLSLLSGRISTLCKSIILQDSVNRNLLPITIAKPKPA